jgi:hypothetical protein
VECEQKLRVVLRLFQQAGWNIALDKSHLVASQSLLYQGFISNSVRMMYFTSADKQTKYLNSLNLLLTEHHQKGSVQARTAASVLGKLQSLKKSHGSIISVVPRNTYCELGHQVIENGWESRIKLNRGVKELQFLLENLHRFNGKAIANAKIGAMTITQQEVAKIVKNVILSDQPVENLLVSDASDNKTFTLFHGEIVEMINYDFQEDEKALSSAHRELIALKTFLRYNIDINRTFNDKVIYWETDNQSCFFFMHHGSKNPNIQNDILQIKEYEVQIGVTVIPLWTRRSHCRIMLADEGSRFSADLDSWGIPDFMLKSICQYFQVKPSIDGFADHFNARCPTYISKYLNNDNIAIDFFAHEPIKDAVYYLCPPCSKIGTVIRKIEESKNSIFILVIPWWPSASWWPLIHDGQNYHPLAKGIYIFNCKPNLYHNVDIDSIFKSSMKFIALLLYNVS